MEESKYYTRIYHNNNYYTYLPEDCPVEIPVEIIMIIIKQYLNIFIE